MDPATADRAVDLLSELSADAKRVTVSFYGGEPLLERRLMHRIVARARRQARATQTVECTTPTNGTLLTPKTLERSMENGIELALSIDGTMGPAERRFPDGTDITPVVRGRLETLVERARGDVLVRLTVTPNNVAYLSENVKSLARLGARTIAYQPALELEWDASAIAAWQRENERIATYVTGRRALGAVGVDVPAIRAIRNRLLGAPRRPCGAGVWHVAVATDGRIFPCYRFVFEASPEHELGTASTGLGNAVALHRLKVLTPEDLQPEDGACSTCPARDGCTHFCPATGALLSGDLRAVPSVVCALMRAQVAAVRGALPSRAVQTNGVRGWTAAVLLVAGVTACGGRAEGTAIAYDAGNDQNALDATSDAHAATGGTGGSTWVGGVCTGGTSWDASVGGICTGGTTWDAGIGGVCGGASGWDAGEAGAVSDASIDAPTPGLCPR